MGYSEKNKQTGVRGYGISIQRYQRNNMLNFQGSIKNEMEFLGWPRKKSCGISRGLGFWAWNWAIPVEKQIGELKI